MNQWNNEIRNKEKHAKLTFSILSFVDFRSTSLYFCLSSLCTKRNSVRLNQMHFFLFIRFKKTHQFFRKTIIFGCQTSLLLGNLHLLNVGRSNISISLSFRRIRRKLLWLCRLCLPPCSSHLVLCAGDKSIKQSEVIFYSACSFRT